MAGPDELMGFVRESLARGLTREQVAEALAEAGWAREQVSGALAAFARVDFPVPVPRPRPSLSARDAFMYLLLFTTLYGVAFNIGNLLFELINRAFPDPAWRIEERAFRDSVRFSISALVVALPIFLWLSRLTNRDVDRDPAKSSSPVRRWLTYLTLFVAACVLIGDFTSLVYRLLGGEITVRFVLKALTVGAIAGTVFWYYLRTSGWRSGRPAREESGAPPDGGHRRNSGRCRRGRGGNLGDRIARSGAPAPPRRAPRGRPCRGGARRGPVLDEARARAGLVRRAEPRARRGVPGRGPGDRRAVPSTAPWMRTPTSCARASRAVRPAKPGGARPASGRTPPDASVSGARGAGCVEERMTDAEVAMTAAAEGAAIVRGRFGSALARTDKGEGDFATEADFESERAILARLHRERPEDGIVAEESGAGGAPHGARTWLVDPLCGTLNYAAGMRVAGVNVALRIGGSLAAAAVADPFSDEIYWTDGAKAFVRRGGRDAPLLPDAGSTLVDLNLDPPFPSAPDFRAVDLAGDPRFAAAFRPRVVSTSIALTWVATGQRAAYITDGDLRGSVHFAAGLAICAAAGCVMTDLRGGAWGRGPGGLIAAADAPTHDAISDLVKQRMNR